MRKSLPVVVAALCLGAAPFLASPAAAHHSFALFDVNKTLALEGTVTSFEWSNPHSWIKLQVPNSQNAADEWLIELPSAGALAREGWNKNYLKVGERLILRVNPLKDGRKGGSLQSFAPANRPDISP
jgi:hypothetical protein